MNGGALNFRFNFLTAFALKTLLWMSNNLHRHIKVQIQLVELELYVSPPAVEKTICPIYRFVGLRLDGAHHWILLPHLRYHQL